MKKLYGSWGLVGILAIAAWLLGSVPQAGAGTERPMVIPPDQTDLKWQPCDPLPEGCEFALVHVDPAKGSSHILVRAPKGYVFPAHWHTYAEYFGWFEGKGSIVDEGGNVMSLTPGAYKYMPSYTIHWAVCDEPCLFLIYRPRPADMYFPPEERSFGIRK